MIEYTGSPQEGEPTMNFEPLKNLKKVEKTFAKGIDKGGRKWYNIRAAEKTAAKMILEN